MTTAAWRRYHQRMRRRIIFFLLVVLGLLILQAACPQKFRLGDGTEVVAQEPPKAQPEAVSCIAEEKRLSIIDARTGQHTEWAVYTAKAPQRLLYTKHVRAEDKRGRRKALAEAAKECAKWVSKRREERTK